MIIWKILQPLGILYDRLIIWYILPRFGLLCPEKSGNPDFDLLLAKQLAA
jgi:hypothetical protein